MHDATQKLVDEALRQVHDQDTLRRYSVAEVKQIVYPLIEALRDPAAQRPTISPEVRDEIRAVLASVPVMEQRRYDGEMIGHVLSRDELAERETEALLARFALPELDPEGVTDANPCGDWPAPCNCDDPDTHDLMKNGDIE